MKLLGFQIGFKCRIILYSLAKSLINTKIFQQMHKIAVGFLHKLRATFHSLNLESGIFNIYQFRYAIVWTLEFIIVLYQLNHWEKILHES